MSRTAARVVPSVRPPAKRLPPLHNGDNLTLAEFEERYDAMPGLKKAELIEGVVYMPPPPVSQDEHSGPHFDMIALLGLFRFATPGVIGGDNGSVYMNKKSLPQPDIFLMLAPGYGGSATIKKVKTKGYVFGYPEFIVEITHTSAAYDLHQKFDLYRNSGVREYAVWRTFDREFDFFRLTDGNYERISPGDDGIVRSAAMPGLWLNVPKLLAGDHAAVATDIQRGIASPEHGAFVNELANRRTNAET